VPAVCEQLLMAGYWPRERLQSALTTRHTRLVHPVRAMPAGVSPIIVGPMILPRLRRHQWRVPAHHDVNTVKRAEPARSAG